MEVQCAGTESPCGGLDLPVVPYTHKEQFFQYRITNQSSLTSIVGLPQATIDVLN